MARKLQPGSQGGMERVCSPPFLVTIRFLLCLNGRQIQLEKCPIHQIITLLLLFY